MGEVYRARDTRLGRDVALKVLAAGVGGDPQRVHRFAQEARAVAALDHPHILAVHDIGEADGTHFVAFELLEGRSFRRLLEKGPVPARRVVELGIQVCRGLAAAHEKGIIHRDLKPENLFVCRDGQAKILDFGLARLGCAGLNESASDSVSPTLTEPGVVLGTAAYMAPEQARGQPADARSDLFALGAVLYELLAGRRAFQASTAADTIAAVLRQDPPEIPMGAAPPALERIVRRCLEKAPDERFQSARDVAFALEALSGPSSEAHGVQPGEGRDRGSPRLGRYGLGGATALGLALAAAIPAAWFLGARAAVRPLPEITRLTYRQGLAGSARFTADGRTVVLTALWDGSPSDVHQMRLETLEPQPLGLAPARLLAVSSRAELAVLEGAPGDAGMLLAGTLARVPLDGGDVRPVLRHVIDADWSPDGRELAVLRQDVSTQPPRLEYPIGRVLADGLWGARAVRVSPRGDKVSVQTWDAALVVDRAGQVSKLPLPPSPGGLAWDPGGEAIWVSAEPPPGRTSRSAADSWEIRSLWRVSLDGSAHETYRAAGGLYLDDVASDGRVLAHLGSVVVNVWAKGPGDPRERRLSTAGAAAVVDMSADGTLVLTAETLPHSVQAFLRPTNGSPARRVVVDAPGTSIHAMLPDASAVLIRRRAAEGTGAAAPRRGGNVLTLVPTGAGEPRDIPLGPIAELAWCCYLDTRGMLAEGAAAGGRTRSWLRGLDDGEWRPVTPEGVVLGWPRWPQGEVVGQDQSEGRFAVYPLNGTAPRPLPGSLPRDLLPSGGTDDGRFGFLWKPSVPLSVTRVDLVTGAASTWRTFQPEDRTGVLWIDSLVVRPTVEAHAYVAARLQQNLYLLEGLRP